MTTLLHRARLRTLSTLVAAALASQMAWAINPFTVRDIRVEGLQRVEPGTVFGSLPLRVGDTYTDETGSAAIRALYALGLFNDVRLDVQGDVLVVIVQERPTVAQIDFAGNREFTKEVLQNALRDAGMTAGRPYDKALIDRAEQEIKRQYINRSLYGAEVQTTVTPVARNQVNLAFNITEGQPARIKDIHIVGNRVFSESKLKDLFDLDTGGWLSWYTKSNQYSRAKLNADLEALRSYYLTRGYLDFKIDSTQVAMSPDKESMSITINITEGERFVVSGVRLEGNYLDREDEFKSLVTIKPGEPYNADEVTATTKAFTEQFGNYGYAFATVNADTEVDSGNHRVAFVIKAAPGRRAYVRRINIEGNTKTRDEVIRREFRQFESSWYDGEKIRLSRDRVDRLGFFTDVGVTTAEVPDAPDQVDLVVTVKEKPTGSVQIGAGYSSAEKLSFTFGLSQDNAFGSGNQLDLQLNTGKYNRTAVVSTTDPYFTPDGISRTVTNIPAAYLAYAERFGYKSTSFPFTVGWSRDTRDSALAPNEGRYQRLFGELGLLGDARYVKTNYQYQQYVPLSKQYTLAFNGELGWGKGLSGQPFPVFKNFYSGGLGSVRGFEQATLGPRDVTGSFIGGARKITLNTEFITPFPGAGNDRTLRLFGFVDVGALLGEHEKIERDAFRASAGVGVSWISPMGPLRFAFAVPVRKKAGDRIEKFQFQIGTSF